MALKRIRLELARTPDHPEGSDAHGYDFIAPLTDEGHLDAEEWKISKDFCTVRRFWGDEPVEVGHLCHMGKSWHFDYDSTSSDDDEPLFKLDRHEIQEGEYVSVTEHDGVQRPFRIVHIQPVP